MILIPAIDLHDGKCVQLKRGLLGSAKVYADDPGSLADHWVEQGAERLHVVDLDGAFSGQSENTAGIKSIVAVAGDTPIQLGGGIRTMDAVAQCIDQGISQVCIGTQAIEDSTFFFEAVARYPDQIILALDARGGFVSTQGWQETTNITVSELLTECSGAPIFAVVFTDIESDGMLTGVNIKRTTDVLAETHIPVIASGGVKGVMDLEHLRDLRAGERRLFGIISGSALYEKVLDFRRGQLVLNTELN